MATFDGGEICKRHGRVMSKVPLRPRPRGAATAEGMKTHFSLAPSILFAAIATLLCSCQTTVTTPSPGMAAPLVSVVLSAGDVVKLSFIGSPELNGSQKIRTDGRLNLPLIGEVQAAGKTITALQVDLSARYKSQLQSTDVLVTLESSAAHVTVSGAISKPTTLSFDRPTTVLQAIMEAGGPNPYGNLKSVRLIRTSRGQHHSEVLNVDAAMKGLSAPFYVRDGDIIYVPQSIF